MKIKYIKITTNYFTGLWHYLKYNLPSCCLRSRGCIPVLPFCEVEKSSLDWKIRSLVQGIKTIGDHLKVKRIQKGLLQLELAQLLGVTEDCITYWENNRSQPQIKFMPKIINFLEYIPVVLDTDTLGGKIYKCRIQRGLSLKKMAKILYIDPTTIASWESNKSTPAKNFLPQLNRILYG